MTDKQLRSLMETDEPTSTICYHGIRILDGPDGEPYKLVRVVGHLVFNYEEEDEKYETVPDHRMVSLDLPMIPETMMFISETLIHSVKHSLRDIDPLFPVQDDDWVPVRNMPDVLKRLFGIHPYNKNGD